MSEDERECSPVRLPFQFGKPEGSVFVSVYNKLTGEFDPVGMIDVPRFVAEVAALRPMQHPTDANGSPVD